MGHYIFKRLLLMIPTLFGVALLVFVMLRVVPGDVVELKYAGSGTFAPREAIERERNTGGNVLFYLSTQPSYYQAVVEGLGIAGLAKAENEAWRRVVVEKPFGHGIDILAAGRGKFSQEFLLLARQASRSFNVYADMLVALLVTLNIVHALALHAKDFAGLSPRGNFHLYLAVERRYVDVRSQGSLRKADRHVAEDVEIFTNEDRMGLDFNDNV
jgi:hypothetical protein